MFDIPSSLCNVGQWGGIYEKGAPQQKCRDLPMSGDAAALLSISAARYDSVKFLARYGLLIIYDRAQWTAL